MVNIYPYLNFDGNCKEAFEFYQRVLGGKLDMQTFGESPMADRSRRGHEGSRSPRAARG